MMRTRKAESPKPTPLMPCRAWKSVDRFLAKNGVRFLLALILFLAAGVGCHWIFLDQFSGAETSAMFFTGLGYDSTSQILSAKSILEQSLLKGDPFWSWSYGLGGDIFSELSYYYSTSPIFYIEFLIKALFGAAGSGIYVQQQWQLIFSLIKQIALMVLMYWLGRLEKKETAFCMVSGLVYGCAGWYLTFSAKFSYMSDFMIWLPLMAIAFHFYRERRTWIPLVCVIALTAASNFYLGYMACMFYGTFFLIMNMEKGLSFKGYTLRMLRLAGVVIVGLLLSSVCFIPAVLALLNADRLPAYAAMDLLASPQFFASLPERLFTRVELFVFPAFLIFAAFLSYRDMSDRSRKKTLLALFWVVAWMIPFASSVMNGFSYATERWHFVVVFAVAYAVPDWLEALQRQRRVGMKALVAVVAGTLILYYTRIVRGSALRTMSDRCCMLLSLAGLVLVFCIQMRPVSFGLLRRIAAKTGSLAARWLRRFCKVALLGCLVLGYALSSMTMFVENAFFLTLSLDEETTKQMIVGDETQREINADLVPAADEFFRVDDLSIYPDGRRFENRSWLNGVYPISAYNSLLPKDLHRWIKRTFDVSGLFDTPSYYRGFGHRLFLENAWGVEYKINGEALPYGYEFETLPSGHTVMHNTFNVGFDLWYDTVLPEDKFNDMDYAQRDAALLQTAVLDAAAEGTYPEAVMDEVTTIWPLSLSEATLTNCRIEQERLVMKKDGSIVFELSDSLGDGEYLLTMRIREVNDADHTITVNGSRTAAYRSAYKYTYRTEEFSYAVPGDAETITLELTPGTYAIEELRLAFNSYDRLEDWTQARNRYNLENLIVSGSHVEGTLRNETPGILTLSMPYNKGWTCTVDGEKTPLIRVNGIFTGIEMEPGEHVIKMRFIPPYLIIGACITGATALALILFALRRPFAKRFGKNSREAENSGDMPRDNS